MDASRQVMPEQIPERRPDRLPFLQYGKRIVEAVAQRYAFAENGVVAKPNEICARTLGGFANGVSLVIPMAEPGREPLKTPFESIRAAELSALLGISLPGFARQQLSRESDSEENARSVGTWTADCGDRGEWSVEIATSHRFSFPLAPLETTPRTPEEYVTELVAIIVDSLQLVREGQSLTIDALIDRRDPARVLPLSPRDPRRMADLGERATRSNQELNPLHSVAQTEPAILTLAKHWALVASATEFRRGKSARPQALRGFELRRLEDWVVETTGQPSEIYEHLARVCNVACNFCYLYGNPAQIAVARAAKVASQTELETRLKYFEPTKRRGLFNAQWEINEFLVDPKLPEVLRALRQRTATPFYFITNGSPLTEKVMNLLAEVMPVHLIVSANTLDADLRAEWMKESENQTRTAFQCFARLRELNIPFGVSLVAVEGLLQTGLRRTLLEIDSFAPQFIRVNLPGWTKHHPEAPPSNIDDLWRAAVVGVREARSSLSTPVLTIPSAFEENLMNETANTARVIGTIRNSPAQLAGILPGDVIVSVNGLRVATRGEAIALLMVSSSSVRVLVERDGINLEVILQPQVVGTYPYFGSLCGKYVFPHGIAIAPSLSREDVRVLAREVEGVAAKSAWVLTSRIMRPAAEQLIRDSFPHLRSRIEFVTIKNDFLGGNIQILDMATVSDICLAIDTHKSATQREPDLIGLPASGFNRAGRDLVGRHWRELGEWYRVPVVLLSSTTRFAF